MGFATRSYLLISVAVVWLYFISACEAGREQRYVFFLHNRFLEEHELHEEHPEYGRVYYNEIVSRLEQSGLMVISEIRSGNVDAASYARDIVAQIDSLIATGIPPDHITVVGTSKGGYIAQYVSTLASNPDLNFVFVASFRDTDIQQIPDIDYCGNILTIFDTSDSFGVSAIERRATSTCHIEQFRELELSTGMGHGFLFRPLDEWMEPTIAWAKSDYEFID